MTRGLVDIFNDFSFNHSNFLQIPGIKASYSPTCDYLYVDIESSKSVIESTELISVSGEELSRPYIDENVDVEDADLGLFSVLGVEDESLERMFFHEFGHFGASRQSLVANALCLYDFIGGNNLEYFARTFREDAYDDNLLVDMLETEFARRQKMSYYADLQSPVQEVCAEIWEACFSEEDTIEILDERLSQLVSQHPDLQEEDLSYDGLEQLMNLNDWSFYHSFPADDSQVKRFTRAFLITVLFLSIPILHSLDEEEDLGALITVVASLTFNTIPFSDYSREGNPLPPPERFLLFFRVAFAYYTIGDESELTDEKISDIVEIYHKDGEGPELRSGMELSEDIKENASTYKTVIDEDYDLIEDFLSEANLDEGEGYTPTLSVFSQKNGETLFVLNQDGLSADMITRSMYWNLFMQSIRRESNLLSDEEYSHILRDLEDESTYDGFFSDTVGLYNYLEDNNLINQITIYQ